MSGIPDDLLEPGVPPDPGAAEEARPSDEDRTEDVAEPTAADALRDGERAPETPAPGQIGLTPPD